MPSRSFLGQVSIVFFGCDFGYSMFSATRLFLCYVYNGVFISRLCKNCSIDVCDAEEAWKLVAGLHSAEMPLELFQQLVREHVETLSDVTSVHADPDLTSQLVLQLPKGCLLQILGEPQQATGQQWGLWKVVCFCHTICQICVPRLLTAWSGKGEPVAACVSSFWPGIHHGMCGRLADAMWDYIV